MQAKNEVDTLLAESFKELALTIPIDKITIKEITDKAGVIRPTFYNHFQDKYELLEWIIRNETIAPMLPLLQGGMIDEAITLIFKNILEDSEFYYKASRLQGQNSFESIVESCIYDLLLQYIQERTGERKPKHIWLTKENVSRYYAKSMTFVVQEWIRTGMLIGAKEMAGIYRHITRSTMENLLQEL